jgi:hypothetical protein
MLQPRGQGQAQAQPKVLSFALFASPVDFAGCCKIRDVDLSGGLQSERN